MLCLALAWPATGFGQRTDAQKLGDATAIFEAFTSDEEAGIPAELIARARGIAILPDVFRGGFFVGARRGRGVMTVRTETGAWSNPAFITLTGGSIGWQFGGETADIVLIFANDNAVKNIASGKFTLGGDATAVAGPVGRRATMAVTFRAEVYSYVRSRGLFAGAAFEGARLALDSEASERYYDGAGFALGPAGRATPPAASRLLTVIDFGAEAGAAATAAPVGDPGAVRTFPLGD